jgi:hypothetical protein
MAGSACTAYDDKDEPLLDDVPEDGGEGVAWRAHLQICEIAEGPAALQLTRRLFESKHFY